jgi:hypothetical protein
MSLKKLSSNKLRPFGDEIEHCASGFEMNRSCSSPRWFLQAGRKNGRWGLGKLVFPIMSASRCFFGLTVRQGDPTPLLLGQAVLRTHRLKGNKACAPRPLRPCLRHELTIKTTGAEEERDENRIILTVQEPDFSLSVDGFDEKRDLVVDFNIVRVRETLDA